MATTATMTGAQFDALPYEGGQAMGVGWRGVDRHAKSYA